MPRPTGSGHYTANRIGSRAESQLHIHSSNKCNDRNMACADYLPMIVCTTRQSRYLLFFMKYPLLVGIWILLYEILASRLLQFDWSCNIFAAGKGQAWYHTSLLRFQFNMFGSRLHFSIFIVCTSRGYTLKTHLSQDNEIIFTWNLVQRCSITW